MTKKQQP